MIYFSKMVATGQKLYLLRIQKGVTQMGLSKRSGIPQANLSKIEQGKQDPTVSTLLKICSALGIRPAELFEEDLPRKSLVWTRASVERIVRGVLDPALKLSPEEKEIADLLRDLVPGLTREKLSSKKLHSAWFELKKRLPADAMRMFAERIQDEEARRRAQAERGYERLVEKIRKIFGRG